MTSSPVALQPDRVSADEFERLSVRLRASLDVSVAHGRTGADERDDAAQQIVLRVLQGSITSVIFSEGEVELKARMERELDRRRQSDRRERDVVGRSGSRGIVGLNAPPLCPTLARRLGASFHGELDEAAAVCAREPGVLRDGQFRAFVNAYEDGWSIADIAAVQGKSPRAVAELLRRVAKRVEQNLFLRLRAVGIDLAADGALLALGPRLEELRSALRAFARRSRPLRAVTRDCAGGAAGRNAPVLCPTLARRLGASFLGEIRRAASSCAREPGVLHDGQFRAFVSAYEDHWSVAEIAVAQQKSLRAVAALLRRAAAKVEQELLLCPRAVGIDLAADGALLAPGGRLEALRNALQALARPRRSLRTSSGVSPGFSQVLNGPSLVARLRLGEGARERRIRARSRP